MTDEIVYAKLRPIFDDILDADEVELTPELTAEDVPGWDSLNHIRLILAVQKAFGVKFSAHEVGDLRNVGSLVTLIQAKAPA